MHVYIYMYISVIFILSLSQRNCCEREYRLKRLSICIYLHVHCTCRNITCIYSQVNCVLGAQVLGPRALVMLLRQKTSQRGKSWPLLVRQETTRQEPPGQRRLRPAGCLRDDALHHSLKLMKLLHLHLCQAPRETKKWTPRRHHLRSYQYPPHPHPPPLPLLRTLQE